MNIFFRILLLIAFWNLFLGCSISPSPEQYLRTLYEEGIRQEESGNKDDAMDLYQEVVEVAPEHLEAQTRLAQIHFSKQEFAQARERFLWVLEHSDPNYLNIRYWLATVYFKEKNYRASLTQLEEILQRSQQKHFYAYRLALQVCEMDPQFHENGLRLANAGILYYPGYAEFYRVKGNFLTHLNREDEAIQAFEEAQKMDELLTDFESNLIYLYVRKGMYLKALKVWDRKVAKKFLWHEDNLQRSCFETLYQKIDIYHSHYPQLYQDQEVLDAKQKECLFDLGLAFKHVGWTRESLEVFQRLLKSDPSYEKALQEKIQIQQFLSFLNNYRDYFYQNYEAYEHDQTSVSILNLMKKLSGFARTHHIQELQTKPIGMIETIMFVYNYLELSQEQSSPLTEYFRKFNHYLLIFNFFGPTETNVKRILSWIPQRTSRVWGKDYTYELFICENSEVYHFKEREVLSSFGGLCLTAHSFWLDLDTYRRIAVEIYKSFRRERLRGEPLEIGGDVLAVHYSSELQAQLSYKACTQLLDNFDGSPDAQKERFIQKILEQLVEAAEYHEVGHICKHNEYLPPSLWSRLNPVVWGSGLSLLISEGFSDKNIAIWSEEKAQLTALKHSSSPYLALYRTMGSMVKDAEISRHSAGYYRIIRGYVDYISRHAALFPDIDPKRNLMEQLYKLKPQEIRNIAEYLYYKIF